jgi:hypothetical protein
MRRSGRPKRQDFDATEKLFYRLEEYYPIGSSPSGLSVRSPNFSVNREKHGGRPEFVLIPRWGHCGIAVFRVQQIPGPITSPGDAMVYSWKVEHDPLEENYHHSEVWTFKKGSRCDPNSNVSKLVKREFRQRLAEAMRVLRPVQIQ